ncbi:MAG TPA: beta-L-arabinofuranosidase domain-containing protein [Acidisarcina sp.]|nr:beta-L-arabinofuranosidase domain-containing protein [Acidisarcina sp.]
MLTRRSFLQSASLAGAALWSRPLLFAGEQQEPALLKEFGYGDVELAPGLAQTQFVQTQSVLMSLNDDSLLKPWRLRAGLPAPGPDMGGWYDEVPLDKTPSGGHGFAPGHSFGQWISALSRGYAVDRDARTRAKIAKLLDLYAPAISGRFYTNFRFPAYDYDKMVIGLLDAHRYAGLPQALPLLDRTTDAAQPHLPPHALDRDAVQRQWRASIGENTSDDYTWDESYTLPENLYLASQSGAGERYRQMAGRYLLDETYFDPLSENRNVLAGHHAYSFCNALSSAMQAYIVTGSRKHLRAASNAFDMITATQSFATGGWGPDESFRAPESGDLYASLAHTHHSFETPCGSYAHFKLSRYLLRVTGDGRYGDSMERVLYNTVLGAKPLQRDGRAFYYSDYSSAGSKSYFPDAWPCCSGTLPQVAADYRILTYLHDADGVYVNLYLPSTVQWTSANGAQVALTQAGNYPLEGRIAMNLRLSRPSEFALRLRIPAWSTSAEGATIRVNGSRLSAPVRSGFATLRRRWRDGDRIALDLALPMRLEAIDAKHPGTVALVRGPLVLFAVTEGTPRITRQQLLAAQRVPGQDAWQAEAASGGLRLLPFTAIGEERYTTYLDVS